MNPPPQRRLYPKTTQIGCQAGQNGQGPASFRRTRQYHRGRTIPPSAGTTSRRFVIDVHIRPHFRVGYPIPDIKASQQRVPPGASEIDRIFRVELLHQHRNESYATLERMVRGIFLNLAILIESETFVTE